MRYYVSDAADRREAPYSVQYALEHLARAGATPLELTTLRQLLLRAAHELNVDQERTENFGAAAERVMAGVADPTNLDRLWLSAHKRWSDLNLKFIEADKLWGVQVLHIRNLPNNLNLSAENQVLAGLDNERNEARKQADEAYGEYLLTRQARYPGTR